VALSQARILYQNHSGDYPQVILTIPVTCRTAVFNQEVCFDNFFLFWRVISAILEPDMDSDPDPLT
jgi:hypothetical protein